MTRLAYHQSSLNADYLRAGGGMALTLGPVLAVEAAPLMVYILVALGGVFAVFAIKTLLRQMTAIEVDDDGLAVVGPLGGALAWSDLGVMRLAYYSTRRDRARGWFALKVKGGGRSIAVDSGLEGFEHLVARAFEAAEANEVELTEVTRANLASLGIHATGAGLPDEHL